MTTKLTGGKTGFNRAVTAAFYGNGCRMHNPAVRYSHSRGFHVESSLHPPDEDCLYSHECSIGANTGRHSLISSDYAAVRAEILERMAS